MRRIFYPQRKLQRNASANWIAAVLSRPYRQVLVIGRKSSTPTGLANFLQVTPVSADFLAISTGTLGTEDSNIKRPRNNGCRNRLSPLSTSSAAVHTVHKPTESPDLATRSGPFRQLVRTRGFDTNSPTKKHRAALLRQQGARRARARLSPRRWE